MASLTAGTVLRKTSDETVNNSTTLQNDDDFSFSVGGNEVWYVEIHAGVQILAASDFKFTFTLPSGATMSVQAMVADAGTNIRGADGTTPGSAIIFISATNPTMLHIWAQFTISSTAGTAQFQWAQNSAVAEDTKILTRAFMLFARES